MKHYFHKFENEGEYFLAYNGDDYVEPWVAAIYNANARTSEDFAPSYNKGEGINIAQQPLTFKILTAGNIRIKAASTPVEYSKDGGTTWTAVSSAVNVAVTPGEELQFRGDNAKYQPAAGLFSGSTAQFDVYGNIMSLISKTDYETLTTFTSTQAFYNLFQNCTTLINARELYLAATDLTQNCYQRMFSGCTSMVSAPYVLPATGMAGSCYESMFAGCSKMTQPPLYISALTLATYNCFKMFENCSGMTKAPDLLIDSFGSNSCNYMYAGCKSLNSIKCTANQQVTASTQNWVSGVSSTGTFTKKSGVSWNTRGDNGVPYNWTMVDA